MDNYFSTGVISCEGCTTSGVFLVAMGAAFTKIFGFSFDLLRGLIILFGALSVAFTYLLTKELTKNTKLSLVASFFLLANPIFFNISHLFITDVPFLFFVVLSVYLVLKGLREHNSKYLIFSALASSAAIFLKQTGMIIPFAILLYVLISNRKLLRNPYVLVAIFLPAILFGAFVLNEIATTGNYYSQEFDVKSPLGFSKEGLYNTWGTLIYLGFFFLPLAYISYKYLKNKIFLGALVFFAISVIVASVFFSGLFPQTASMPYLENILNKNGLGTITLPGQEGKSNILPEWLWTFITIASIISASVIATEILSRIRKKNFNTPEFFLILVVASLLLTVLLKNGAFFDRYLTLFIPLLSFIFVGKLAKSKLLFSLSIIFLAALFALSLIGTLDYINWNEARWQEVSLLESQGIPKESINGGFEFCLYNYGMQHQYEYWKRVGIFDSEGIRPHNWGFCPGQDYIISFSKSPEDLQTDRSYAVEKERDVCLIDNFICSKMYVLKAI